MAFSGPLNPCFVESIPIAARTSAFGRPTCARRSRKPVQACHLRRGPFMMAKYQKKEQTSSERPEDNRPLDELIPPPLLPTLTTLTGGDPLVERSPKESMEQEKSDKQKDEEVVLMGSGMSASEESSVLGFLAGVVEEFKLIEWPSFGRIVRLTVICILTIVIATAALYLVDGFFYRVSKYYFGEDF